MRHSSKERSLTLLWILSTLVGCRALDRATAAGDGDGSLEGPYAHANLAIYVVRGGATDTRDYITLDQGLSAGTVGVREVDAGGQVNTLEVENRSSQFLFLHAGDIVEGGKQDRTIGADFVIPPHSKPQSVDAFCVEHGRWDARNGDGAFRKTTGMVAGNRLKISIQAEKDQGKVWNEVSEQEAKAALLLSAPEARASGTDVPQTLSSTGTYNAVVENDQIAAARKRYVDALLPRLKGLPDATGLVVAINGELVSADVYGSTALFKSLAPKLIDGYALEAVLARDPDAAASEAPAPTKEAVAAFLEAPERETAKHEKIDESMSRKTRSTDKTVLFEYTDERVPEAARAKPVHKNYVAKKK